MRAVKFTLLAGDIDMTFVEHLNSCARQCIAIADVLESSFRCGIPIQRDHLVAGALLADVGKPLEYDKDASGKVVQGEFGQQLRHPFSGVALAHKHGIPGEVLHIIATHSHEGDKVERSIESIIFHHADFRGLRYRKAPWKARCQELKLEPGIGNLGQPASPMPATATLDARTRVGYFGKRIDMGLTLVEKIATRYADGLAAGTVVRSGDFITIRPKHVMTHDNTGAVIPKFKQIGATKVAEPKQPVLRLITTSRTRRRRTWGSTRRSRSSRASRAWTFTRRGRGFPIR